MIEAKGVVPSSLPFPHASMTALVSSSDADALLAWMEKEAPWRLRIESFYEQYEFSLLSAPPPSDLAWLTSETSVKALEDLIRASLGADGKLELVDISAHRLVEGQTIRVHNDFIGDLETHRVLLQLNRGWSVDNGGILMLFGSDRPEDVRAAIIPQHGSAFVFEISPQSFHAVSTIRGGDRFTLVYTFRMLMA